MSKGNFFILLHANFIVQVQQKVYKDYKYDLLYTYLREYLLVTQSCLTLCNPMDHILPGSSVHGILQARILEWIAIPFSRGSSQPRDWTWVSHIRGRFFIIWATREAQQESIYHAEFYCYWSIYKCIASKKCNILSKFI